MYSFKLILLFAMGLISFATASGSVASVRERLTAGQRCDSDPGWCGLGLECVGPSGRRRCFPIKKEGESCKNPYLLCAEGLKCNYGTCEKILINRGSSCNREFDMCKPPLSCVGRTGNKRCYEKGDVGDSCGGEPFWVCKDHLKCKNGYCARRLLRKGASCNKPTDECKPPLSCVGNSFKRCFKKREEGQTCEVPFWVCEHGLVCNAYGRCEHSH